MVGIGTKAKQVNSRLAEPAPSSFGRQSFTWHPKHGHNVIAECIHPSSQARRIVRHEVGAGRRDAPRRIQALVVVCRTDAKHQRRPSELSSVHDRLVERQDEFEVRRRVRRASSAIKKLAEHSLCRAVCSQQRRRNRRAKGRCASCVGLTGKENTSVCWLIPTASRCSRVHSGDSSGARG